MSNSTFDTAVAAELATLTRVTDPATEPLGYGSDLSCVVDVTDDFAELDPDSPEGISQSLVRRYMTPRGTLPDDADYGLDIRAWCNRGMTVLELRSLSAQMASEARKDDRIDDVRIDLGVALATSSIDCKIVITPADPRVQTFTLTFSATDAGVLKDTIHIASA
jgi:hypothetical protein